MISSSNITGILLAGGTGKRMGGVEKGLLCKYGKKTLAENGCEILRPVTNQIIVSANTTGYEFLNIPIYSDIIPNCGPLGGIITGLSFSKTKWNIILATDIPLVPSELFSLLLKNTNGSSVVLPEHNGILQTVCGLYSTSCLPVLKQCLSRNIQKMKDVVSLCRFQKIKIPNAVSWNSEHLFWNVNTPEDWKNIQKFLYTES